MQSALSRARLHGGRFAELFVEARRSVLVRLDDGRVREVTHGEDRGFGLRVLHGTAQSYAFSNRLQASALQEAAVAVGSRVRSEGPSQAGMDLRQLASMPDAGGARLEDDDPTEDRVAWLREADDAARAVDAAVRQVAASYLNSVQQLLIVNSDGLWVEDVRRRARLTVQVTALRDGVVQSGFEATGFVGGVADLEGFSPATPARRAAERAVTMLGGRPAPAGELPVVLGPACGGILFHEACGHGLEIDQLHKEASIFRGRLRQGIASPLFTGVDDATVPEGWGSFAVDDEGAPAQRTVLLDRGELVGYLYDRLGADRDGVATTGNGRRQSYASLPLPRMTNAYVLPGADDADEIVRDTARGLYATVLGGGGVNPATGDFTFTIAEGYMIQHGRLTHPVRGATLTGNGPRVVASVDALADDFGTRDAMCVKQGQTVPVSNGSPTLRLVRMTVGGTDA
jgi:TldD protein